MGWAETTSRNDVAKGSPNQPSGQVGPDSVKDCGRTLDVGIAYSPVAEEKLGGSLAVDVSAQPVCAMGYPRGDFQ